MEGEYIGVISFEENNKFYILHNSKKLEVVQLQGNFFVGLKNLVIGTEVTYTIVPVCNTYGFPDSWEIDDWVEQGLLFDVAVINPEVILEVEKPKRLVTNLSFWEEFKKVFLWKI